jgi:hypothetical protein
MVGEYNDEDAAIFVTYDSGADGHYISEKDRPKLGLPILRISAKKVGVANGDTCRGKYVTALPFPQFSKKAAEADTFNDFPTSLMRVGKMADDGNISISTKKGVSVYKEEDVLITCKGEAILIGKQDKHGL